MYTIREQTRPCNKKVFTWNKLSWNDNLFKVLTSFLLKQKGAYKDAICFVEQKGEFHNVAAASFEEEQYHYDIDFLQGVLLQDTYRHIRTYPHPSGFHYISVIRFRKEPNAYLLIRKTTEKYNDGLLEVCPILAINI